MKPLEDNNHLQQVLAQIQLNIIKIKRENLILLVWTWSLKKIFYIFFSILFKALYADSALVFPPLIIFIPLIFRVLTKCSCFLLMTRTILEVIKFAQIIGYKTIISHLSHFAHT